MTQKEEQMKERDRYKIISNNTLYDIPKKNMRNKVILIGKGKSIDNLNKNILVKQTDYDTCTIADAIKVSHIDQGITYLINYHYRGLYRIKKYLDRAKYVCLPEAIIDFQLDKLKAKNCNLNNEKIDKVVKILNNHKNIFYFKGSNLKYDDIDRGNFNIQFKDNKLYQAQGSVTGAVYFLVACMGYKEIYYIGFDGSFENSTYDDYLYGTTINMDYRKRTKVLGAGKDYKQSWKNMKLMLDKYYLNIKFEPLRDKDLLK